MISLLERLEHPEYLSVLIFHSDGISRLQVPPTDKTLDTCRAPFFSQRVYGVTNFGQLEVQLIADGERIDYTGPYLYS
jgi:hypothetical protein